MSRKTAIFVLITMAVAIGLVVLISYIPFTNIDPEAMPVLTAQYVDQGNDEAQENLNCSAYHWKVNDATSEEIVWLDADPENIFHLKYATKEILPGDLEISLQLVWLEPPETIIIKRWPLTEWKPADFEATHSQGEDVVKSWETHWKKTNIGFDVEHGNLYGIWVYYGEEWVQYSFIVPVDNPIT